MSRYVQAVITNTSINTDKTHSAATLHTLHTIYYKALTTLKNYIIYTSHYISYATLYMLNYTHCPYCTIHTALHYTHCIIHTASFTLHILHYTYSAIHTAHTALGDLT